MKKGSDLHRFRGCGMHSKADQTLHDTIRYPKFTEKEANQTYGPYGHTFQVKLYQEFSSIHTDEGGLSYTHII